MKKITMLLVGLLLIWSLPAEATLIEITSINKDRESTSEFEYATYINSGNLIGIFKGNDCNQLEDIESWLVDNDYGFIYDGESGLNESGLNESGFQLDEAYKSGKWSTYDAIQFYVVKATNAFALYEVDPLTSSGTWSTYDLWVSGQGGKGGIEISHLSGYNFAPVPEPSTMLLLGTGLIGIARISRKRFIR